MFALAPFLNLKKGWLDLQFTSKMTEILVKQLIISKRKRDKTSTLFLLATQLDPPSLAVTHCTPQTIGRGELHTTQEDVRHEFKIHTKITEGVDGHPEESTSWHLCTRSHFFAQVRVLSFMFWRVMFYEVRELMAIFGLLMQEGEKRCIHFLHNNIVGIYLIGCGREEWMDSSVVIVVVRRKIIYLQ